MRVGVRSVGLGLDRGLPEFELAVGDGHLFFGLDPSLFGLAASNRLGDRGLLLGPCRLGATEILEVVALGLDVLQLERVEYQTLVGQRRLGFLGDLASEGCSILDDLFDREPTHDGSQRARQHLLGEVVDLVLLAEETL